MQLVTVGTKYQIVIPKEIRKKMRGVKPGSKIGLNAVDENTATIKTEPQSWVDRTSGMMTEAWKDIDPIKELQKMKDEWEERLEKFEKIAATK